MRTPSSSFALLLWHRAAITGQRPVITSEPQCGWFKRRMAKKCCWVPAVIFVHREICGETGELLSDERLLCDLDGSRADVDEQWLHLAKNPIEQSAHAYLTRLRAWQRVNAPDEWDPYRPVDLTKTPILEE
jgi:hypothetical protein